MAVTNTGVVLRTITGVNESDLFLDSEATSVTTNTGVVERSIVGVHDANFVRPLGDELILNGGFDTDTNWQKQTGWSIGVGTANCDGSQNFPESVYQDGVTIVGKTYKITYTLVSVTSGAVRAMAGTLGGANQSTIGTYTEYLTATSNAVIQIQGNSSFIGSIDNVSVKEVLVNRESTTTNTGIVERSVTGLNESIAFRQDVRTNLMPYSEDFSNASWAKAGLTVNSNQEISPYGTLSAAEVNISATSAHFLFYQVSVSQLTNYVFSFYVKKGTATDASYSVFNEMNLTDIVSSTSYFDEIPDTEWVRVAIEFTTPSGGTSIRVYPLRDGSSTGTIYIYGVQLEEASQATSYIPTNGAAVTVDNNSTSVVNNTGIVERPITGVNESDAMFPDNTESTVVSILDTVLLLMALEARATTFENREATQNILINLQKC